MAFCYDKLKGRIVEMFGTRDKFAETMGFSKATLSAKLNNKSEWTQEEVIIAVEHLKLNSADIPAYFFTQKV